MHTGQHYDDSLSRVFFTELGLARPDRELGIAGGHEHLADRPHARGARAAARAELGLDAVLVYGDTNSTLAGALAAAQAAHPGGARRGGHALVRSDDARGAATACSPTISPTCCCARRTPRAANLKAESVAGTIEVVGDVMVDVALRTRSRRARADSRDARARTACRAAPICCSPPTGRATSMTPPACARSCELVRALPAPVLFPRPPAHACAPARRRPARGARAASTGLHADRAARIRRVQRAALPGARGR